MLRTAITLITKKLLTHDVYELSFSCPEMASECPKPGQYVLFQLAPGLSRAYSIAHFSLGSPEREVLGEQTPSFTLIIKRIPDGKGSPMICDAEIGETFSVMLPLGHFFLRDTPKSKCFIGTGTGFAPLYCQLNGCLTNSKTPICSRVAFVFGVRHFEDSFYEEAIHQLGEKFTDFQYVRYFSRESDFPQEGVNAYQGYVTDWLTLEHMACYDEYYICGSPPMVKSVREILQAGGVSEQNIFWEQF